MEAIARKRDRSNDPPYSLQTKIHVNQQIVNLQDPEKMKKVHAKTIELLFKGAKSVNLEIPPEQEKDMTKLLILSGDGEIDLLYHETPTDLSLERKKSKCCDREAYIDLPCINCNVNLCEFCGYSCTGCGAFLCNNCITIFGCGSLDFPKCEKCKLFDAAY